MKFRIVVLIGILTAAFSVNAGMVTLSISDTNQPPVLVEILNVDIQGDTIFECPQAHWLSDTGQPQIPWQVITVLVPPDVDIATAFCEVLDTEYHALEGTWDIDPAPA